MLAELSDNHRVIAHWDDFVCFLSMRQLHHLRISYLKYDWHNSWPSFWVIWRERGFALFFILIFSKKWLHLYIRFLKRKNNGMEAWIDGFWETDYTNWLMQLWRLRSSTIYHAGNRSKFPLPLPYRHSPSEDWVMPPTLGRVIYFTESTDSNAYLIQKHAFRHL